MAVFITQECDCGKYEPVSTAGVIISSCKHCGGLIPRFVAGPPRNKRNISKLIEKLDASKTKNNNT